MPNLLSINTRRQSWNLINTLIAIIIVMNYFHIYFHLWFVELLGGVIIKLWLPSALLLFFIAMQRAVTGRPLTFKKDSIYSIKVLCFFYFIFGSISLVAHGEGMWYLGKNSLFMFMPVVLFGIIIAWFNDNEYIKRVLQILFVGGLIMSLYVEYLFFTGSSNFEIMEPLLRAGDSGVFKSALGGHFRHGMPGLGINTYAGMLPPLVLVGLYMALNSTSLLKYFYYAASLFISYAVLETMSRAAFIALIVGLLLFLWYTSEKKYFTYIILIMAFISIVWLKVGVLLRVVGLLSSSEIFSESKYITDIALKYDVYTTVEDQHITLISRSTSAFLENPFFGVGMNEMMIINEHNRYVELLATNGLAGFIPFVALIITMIFISRKILLKEIKNNSQDKEIGVILFAGLISFVFYMNAAPSEFYFYWIWFALVIAWVRNCNRAQYHR